MCVSPDVQGKEAGAVLRVNVFREHRQTVQYLYPHDHAKLEQAEVLAIDDAASLDPEVHPVLSIEDLSAQCRGGETGIR